MPVLDNPIPNLYTQQGVAFSYQFPANTFSGSGLTYTAYQNRPNKERQLPAWLTFNPATRTFSGTPANWIDLDDYPIVVECTDGAAQKAYSIFTLSVSFNNNTGRPCYRSASAFNHTLTAANIAAFDPATVSAGQWVKVSVDLWPLQASTETKLASIRTNGGYLVWVINQSNLSGFNYTKVQAGETIALDFSAGNITGVQPNDSLLGLQGAEIYITNLAQKGFIEDNFKNPLQFRESRHVRVIGQPANHTPFVDVYGIGVKSTTYTLIRITNGNRGNISFCGVEVGPTNAIGFHIKTDLTHPPTANPGTDPNNFGDRRASQNTGSEDHNMTHIRIRNCYVHNVGGEGIYIGGGFFSGRSNDGNRFYHIIEYCAVEYNIITDCGWDAIQMKCITREGYMRYNYVKNSALLNRAGQNFGIFFADGFAGEVAYNYVQDVQGTGIRGYDTGLTRCHHNIVVRCGRNDAANGVQTTQRQGYYGAALPNPTDAPVQYTGQHSINTDIINNLGYSPGFNARPDLTNANLYCYIFHNTFIGVGAANSDTLVLFSDTPQGNVQNNLFVNCGKTTINAPSIFTKTGNLMLTGVTLTDLFVDPVNEDYRIKVGSAADATGVDISSYSIDKDYGGKTRVAATPGVGAFESNSFAWTERYNYVVNGAGNVLPSISVGADKVVNLPVSSTSLSATASDPDGVIVSYLWTQISGPNAANIATPAASTTNVTGLVAGAYVFRCTATDNAGGTAFDEITVTVQSPTQTYHKWYRADNNAGLNSALVQVSLEADYTPPVSDGKWYRRGTIPKPTVGNVNSIEYFSAWVQNP